jgi:hypothetical protein
MFHLTPERVVCQAYYCCYSPIPPKLLCLSFKSTFDSTLSRQPVNMPAGAPSDEVFERTTALQPKLLDTRLGFVRKIEHN